jgi:hypothetical protein
VGIGGMMRVKYYKTGYIGGDTWILYDADAIEHLPVAARKRLAELENEHNGDVSFDYMSAEKILISEELYDPNSSDLALNNYQPSVTDA